MTGPKWLSLGHPQQSVISVIVSYVSASDMENINKNNAYDAYDGYDAFSKVMTGLTFNKEKRPRAAGALRIRHDLETLV